MTDRRLRLIAAAEADATALAAVLDDARIRVLMPARPGWAHQVLLISLVDLLGRLFPRITVDLDGEPAAASVLPPGAALLRHRVDAALANGGLRQPEGPGADEEIVVHIGPAASSDRAVLHVDGRGWISYLGTSPSRLSDEPAPPVAVGPVVAACRAAAAVTSRVLAPISTAAARAVAATPDSCYSSALTYTVDTDPIVEPSVHASNIEAVLVGAGSVGGAAAYTLAFTPELSGRLTIVDPQQLEEHNPDRALLATAAAAAGELRKVDVAVRALAHHEPRLIVSGHFGTITDYHGTLDRDDPLPLVLAAVDSAPARRAIQDCLPLEVVNAACHPQEFTVSGHRTDDGPCVCCLHMADVLDRNSVKVRVLAGDTGLNERMVTELLIRELPLADAHIAGIEKHRQVPAGSFARYRGATLEDLWRDQLLYGVTRVRTANGTTAAVAAPYLTALAGVLLAAEALKAAAPEAAPYRLGRSGPAIRYIENPTAGPGHARLDNPERWPGSECLCRSARRLRLLRTRYALFDSANGT